MWVAEFKVWHAGSSAIEVSKEFGVVMESQYLNVFVKNKKEFVTKVLVLRGRNSLAAMPALLSRMKRQGILSAKVHGNQIFFIAQSFSQFHTSVLNSNVFFVKPQLVKEGFLWWTVASWEKKHLVDLFNKIRKLGRKKASIELLSLKKSEVHAFASSALSALTEKQRDAFEKACASGYYSYPRRVSLEGLAEKYSLPYATFKDRLRSAEAKLWPCLAGA